MYRKNTAGQSVGFVLVNASTGAAITGATVTVRRALDTGAQASATGTVTELGNGQYRFDLSQADTNGDEGSYLFTATNAVPVEKTLVFTAANPSDGVRFGLTALPNAAAGASGGVYVIGGTQPSFPTVPSAADNATAVRSELTTELGRIDATVSSRLATSGYTAPPSAATIATQVWATTIEGSRTAAGLLRLIFSAVANKLSGANTTTVRTRDDADTKDRLVVTVDSYGNRTAVTKDDA